MVVIGDAREQKERRFIDFLITINNWTKMRRVKIFKT